MQFNSNKIWIAVLKQWQNLWIYFLRQFVAQKSTIYAEIPWNSWMMWNCISDSGFVLEISFQFNQKIDSTEKHWIRQLGGSKDDFQYCTVVSGFQSQGWRKQSWPLASFTILQLIATYQTLVMIRLPKMKKMKFYQKKLWEWQIIHTEIWWFKIILHDFIQISYLSDKAALK